VLALIRSGEIADFENQLVTAQSNLAVSRKNLDVAEDMYQTGLTAEKDLVAARKEVQKAEGELRRIQEVLRIYGVATAGLLGEGPHCGFVVEKNITETCSSAATMWATCSHLDLDEIWTMATCTNRTSAR
jgi:cobalt-zinc-cadmium efflux system membrane fusion protein